MSYYFKLGQVPHKRHTQFRQPDGSLYHEELMGIRGLLGRQSLLYHLRPPTACRTIDGGCPVDPRYADAGPVRATRLRTRRVEPPAATRSSGRVR